MKEYVVLVDKNDNPRGLMEKQKAHIEAALHRAFSVFIFNSKNELMLQQRALHKYHSPGLWTNTCCSHPRDNEEVESAAHRRMMEEMGFDCSIKKAFDFVYHSDVGGGLTEHEFDHVFIGYDDSQPKINAEEVHDWKYMKIDNLSFDIKTNPEKYTVWFKIAFKEMYIHLQKNKF